MSCPECGARIHRKQLFQLSVYLSLIMAAFCISLFIFPFEIFFLVSLGLVFALRGVEKEVHKIEKSELRCPDCGHVVSLIHPH